MPTWVIVICAVVIVLVVYVSTTKNKASEQSPKQTKENDWVQKGIEGEQLTKQELEMLNQNKKILTNIYLPKKQGCKTTEIDLLCITEKALFIIENKNYSGTVYGKKEYDKWIVYNGSKKYQFYSPLKQNQTHIEALAKMFIETPKDKMISLIVFNNGCKVKFENVEHPHYVTSQKNLLALVEQISQKLPKIFSQQDMDYIYNMLEPFSNATQEKREDHIKSIKEHYAK